jgi:predicted nucleic acid-binding protein
MQSMLFVDTSGWYAAFNRADGAHSAIRQALAQARKARRAIVTSDYVIDETLTLVRMRAGHRLAVEVGEAVWRRGGAEIIDVDAAIRDAAWQIFRRYREHTLSFTDCVSAALMRQRGLEEVLTLDAHFVVLGFRCVPLG